MLNVQKEIIENGFDETVEKHCLKVYKDRGLVSINYNQIDSPKNEVTNECRGLILYEKDWSIAAYPFYRFFNKGEGSAEDVDAKISFLQEKLDGSIISLFWNKIDENWQPATRGRPFADGEVSSSIGAEKMTFAELFNLAVSKSDHDFTFINEKKNFTFIFELVSQYNRVVTPYKMPELYLIGARNNDTLIEIEHYELNKIARKCNVRRPDSYEFNSFKNIDRMLENLDAMQEGFVLVDYRHFNENNSYPRIKIKNPRYLALAHMVNAGGGMSTKRAISLILSGEEQEVIGYFPEFESEIINLKNKISSLKEKIDLDYSQIKDIVDQKEFALAAKDTTLPWAMFALRNKKVKSPNGPIQVENANELILNTRPEKVEEIISNC